MEDLFPTQQIPETLEINNCTNGDRKKVVRKITLVMSLKLHLCSTEPVNIFSFA